MRMSIYPRWLKWASAILVAISLVGLLADLSSPAPRWLGRISQLAGIATLIVLIFYAYDTHLIAIESWIPSAAFSLDRGEDGVGVHFHIVNHSKKALRCWCNLHITINGKPAELGGFYSGESHVDLQPLGGFRGVFFVHKILEKAGLDMPPIYEQHKSEYGSGYLRLDVEFSYSEWGKEERIISPVEPYYYDFYLAAFISRR